MFHRLAGIAHLLTSIKLKRDHHCSCRDKISEDEVMRWDIVLQICDQLGVVLEISEDFNVWGCFFIGGGCVRSPHQTRVYTLIVRRGPPSAGLC